MKKKLIIVLIIIALSSVLSMIAYNNYIYSNNSLSMIFSGNDLSRSEREWLKEKGQLIYASDHDTPPLRYVDNSDQYKGIVIDYMEALSEELGIEIVLKPAIWQDALDDLKDGNIDLVDMYPSDERGEIYEFTNTIFYQNAVILIPNGSTINLVSDLNGRKVAAQTGDFVNGYVIENAPEVEIINVDDYRESIQLLKAGHVEAVVGDESVIYHFMNEYDMTMDFHIVDELLYKNRFVLGVPKIEKELVSILNKGIKGLNRKNTLISIQQKWFGISTPISRAEGLGRYLIPGVFISVLIGSIGYIVFTWNYSLKTEVEQALNTTELALQTTFDGLKHLLIVLDDTQHIVNGNQALFNRLQLSKHEIIGQKINAIFPEDIMDNSEITLDHTVYEVGIHTIEMSDQACIILLKDITEKKIAERNLLNANKMAAVGQLAAGIAHEIRNPLGLIRSHTYLLRNTDESRNDSYDMIEKSVDRASRIIDNLLNFSSISGNEMTTFNLMNFNDSLIELYQKVLTEKNIQTVIDCPNEKVFTNKEAMKHILSNLIGNAIDAIGDTGTIWISYHISDQLTIRLRDSGPGVSNEILHQLFNPFFTTKTAKGTGLGLYIVYTEIEKLHGHIKAQNNDGLEFIITLPIERKS